VVVGRLDLEFEPDHHGRQLTLSAPVQPPHAAYLGGGRGRKRCPIVSTSRRGQLGAQCAWTREGVEMEYQAAHDTVTGPERSPGSRGATKADPVLCSRRT